MCFGELIDVEVEVRGNDFIVPKCIDLEGLGVVLEIVEHVVVYEQAIAFLVSPDVGRGDTDVVFVEPLDDEQHGLLRLVLVD